MALELISTPLFNDGSLKSYYRFEGNSTDAKGSNNGTDTSITYSSGNGMFGQGAGFNGSSSKISYGNVNDPAAGSFSISFWLNLTGTSVRDHGIVAKLTGGNGYQIAVGSSTNQIYFLGQSSSSNIWNLDNTTVGSGAMHHVVCVADRSGNNAYIYVDGIQANSGAISNTNSIANAANMVVGVDNSGTAFCACAIDDLAYFNRALSAQEVNNLFTGIFSSDSYSYWM